MKTHFIPLRHLLVLTGGLIVLSTKASAATLYWDGGAVDILTDGNGISGGTAGNWNTSLLNWDAGSSPHVAWNNANLDTALFGGTAGTVSLNAPITVGGLTFISNSGYTIAAGTQGLTLGAVNNNIRLVNVSGASSAAAITGTVTSAAGSNMILSSVNPGVASTLTFSGISAGGWSGSTTINQGATLVTTSTSGNINRVLNDTSGITLNGGRIQFNRATNANIGAISDTAAITVNGGGIFSVTSGDSGGLSAIENIGAVTVNSGQMNFVFTNNASSGQQVIMSALTRAGSTSALTFSGSSLSTSNKFIVTGAGTTTAGEIIGSWATTGPQNTFGAPTDYAVFNSGEVHSANIAASAESTWSTVHAATSNYTLANAAGSAAAGNLTAARNINSLRNTTTAAAAAANSTTEYFTLAGNTFANGDVVSASGTGGLTAGIAYYVINAGVGGADTFQLSTTPAGGAVNLTNTTAGQIAGGITLSAGNNLGTTGILNGSTTALAIGGAGAITLPTSTSGNLFVTAGAGAIAIDAPITNNGAGVLTLVKSGNSTLRLSGTNTYTGGTVINGGQLLFASAGAWGGAGRDVTFGGTGTLSSNVAYTTGGALTVNTGATGTITGSTTDLNVSFDSTSGSGTLVYSTSSRDRTLNIGDASGFNGDLVARLTGNANYANSTNQAIQFSALSDTAGSALKFLGGQSDGNQRLTVALTGDAGPVVFNNRQVQILAHTTSNWGIRRNDLRNNNANEANTWIINTDLAHLSNQDRIFELSGSNTGNNAFNGVISNGGVGGTINLRKEGAGKWIIGGDNSYTGTTTVIAGRLEIGGSGRLGNGNYAGAISIANTSSGRLVYNSSANQTLSGVVSGAGAFVKNNTGTLILTNTNSLTGATTISGGVLAINGAGTINSSAVTINGGDFRYNSSTAYSNTLTFTSGTISGTNWGGSLDNLTIGANRTVSPGNSPGTASVGGQTWAGGGTYLWEINNITGTAGADPGWDLINGTGTLNITATDLSQFTIDITSLTSGNVTGEAVNFNQLLSYAWLIADFAVIDGFDADAFNIDDSGFDNEFSGTFAVVLGDDASVTGGDSTQIYLTYTAIPEPRAALLGALGVLLLLRRRR